MTERIGLDELVAKMEEQAAFDSELGNTQSANGIDWCTDLIRDNRTALIAGIYEQEYNRRMKCNCERCTGLRQAEDMYDDGHEGAKQS